MPKDKPSDQPRHAFRSEPSLGNSDRPPEELDQLDGFAGYRLKIGQIVDHPWYEKVQRVATYTSVFGEAIYRGGCGVAGVPADENMADVLRLGPLPLFAANLGLKTAAQGPEHLKTPEGVIDAVSLLAEGLSQGAVGNTRLARLLKGVKGAKQVAKFMRAASVAGGKKSLEDQSMNEIQQDFTWLMMGLLAGMPLVADFKDLDYSDPMDAAREVGFNVAIIAMAKKFTGSVRKVINQNYTQALDGSRDRVHQMIEENPELGFLKKEFKYFDTNASEHLGETLGANQDQIKELINKLKDSEGSSIHPSIIWQQWTSKYGIDAKYEDHDVAIDLVTKDEILVIVEGLLESMIAMKDLINPVGEDLELNEKGEIKTKQLDAVVMVTDLRNFTPLTMSDKIRGNIFGFLKLNYFAYLRHSIKSHHGKILNHTGDGLVIYFTDTKDKTKEENAIACGKEINKLTNLMDDVWHNQGIVKPEDDHRTGIGLSSGTLRIGDVLTFNEELKKTHDPDEPPRSTFDYITDVQAAFEMEATRICDWIEVVNDERRQGGIARLVGMGEPINIAARLESIAKNFPDFNCFIRQSHWESLPEALKKEYESIQTIQLKGVDEVEMIYGMRREEV